MPDIVEPLSRAVSGWADRPYALFGHSMGAHLGFELNWALEPRARPVHFFLSGMSAPHLDRSETQLHSLDDDALIDALRALGGTPDEVLAHRELMELTLPVIRADFEVIETHLHRERPPLDLPASLLGGADDPSAPPSEIKAWARYFTPAPSVEIHPGDHFYLEAALDRVIARVVQTLEAR